MAQAESDAPSDSCTVCGAPAHRLVFPPDILQTLDPGTALSELQVCSSLLCPTNLEISADSHP